jgi:pyocin large subunit-like protein
MTPRSREFLQRRTAPTEIFRRRVAFVAALVAWIALSALSSCSPSRDSARADRETSSTASASSESGAPRAAYPKSAGFKSRSRLEEHFEKHGAEFAAASPEQYLALAKALRDAPLSNDLLEIVRKDSVVTRFDRQSGAFLAFDENGTIRTFFRPNDGERYFHRQAERDPP